MNDRQQLEARILDLEAAQLSSRRCVRRLTATNVLLAVVVLAFGGAGAAYAIAAANTVDSAAIIDGAVKHIDVKEGSLGSSRFLDNSVTSGKITDGTVTRNDLTAGKIGIVRAYAWVSNASGASTPSEVYSYNSGGGPITVAYFGPGVYSVTIPNLVLDGGNIQITGYGSSATWCKVSSWAGSSATVRCFNAAGTATDSQFNIAVIK